MNRYQLVLFVLLTNSLCIIYAQKNRARNQIDSLLKVVHTDLPDTSLARLYAYLSTAYANVNTDSLEYYAQKSFHLSQANTYDLGLALSLEALGTTASDRDEYRKAIDLFKKSLSFFEKLEKVKGVADVNTHLGVAYYRSRIYDSAVYHFNIVLGLPVDGVGYKNLLRSEMVLGHIYTKNGDFDEAHKHFNEALRYGEKGNLTNPMANVYQGIGLLFVYTDEVEKGIPYMKKAVDSNRKVGNKMGLAISLSNLAGMYQMVHRYEDALEMLKEALILFGESGGSQNPVAVSNLSIGKLYIELKQYEEAKKHLEEAFKLFTHEEAGHLPAILNSLGKIEFHLGNYPKARRLIYQAIDSAKLHHTPKNMLESYLYLTQIDTVQNNYVDALHNYQAYVALKDSQEKRIKKDELDELRTKFDVAEKEKALLKASQEIELRDFQGKQRLIIIWITTISTIISIILVGLLFSQKKKLKTFNDNLQANEKLLQKSLLEKETLLKEIHHRVKNNLQLVLSLLNIQAREMHNTEVNNFLEKGQTRISSMALIHQTLYQGKDLDKVDIQEYLESLISAIYEIFNVSEKCFPCRILTYGFQFSIQTSIPLGLIVNELVSNSLKHAFTDRIEGKIQIEIRELPHEEYELLIYDNGVGFPSDHINKKTLGLEIVSLLTCQLGGELKLTNTNGTLVRINFQEISHVA